MLIVLLSGAAQGGCSTVLPPTNAAADASAGHSLPAHENV